MINFNTANRQNEEEKVPIEANIFISSDFLIIYT